MWRRKIPIAGVDRVYHDCRNRAHSGEARRPGLDTTKRFTLIPPCPSCAKSQAVKKARRLRGGRYGLDVGDITPGRATSQGSGHASASPAKQMMSLSCGDSLTTAPGTVLARSLFQTPMPAVSVLALVAVLYPPGAAYNSAAAVRQASQAPQHHLVYSDVCLSPSDIQAEVQPVTEMGLAATCCEHHTYVSQWSTSHRPNGFSQQFRLWEKDADVVAVRARR